MKALEQLKLSNGQMEKELRPETVEEKIKHCEDTLAYMHTADMEVFEQTKKMKRVLEDLVAGLGLVPFTASQSQAF